MTYDTILARSFSRYEQRKLGYGAFVGCLIIAFSFCVFKPYLGALPALSLRLSTGGGLKMLSVKETRTSQDKEILLVTDDAIAKPEPSTTTMNYQENVTTKLETPGNIMSQQENVTTKHETPLNHINQQGNVTAWKDNENVTSKQDSAPITSIQENVAKNIAPPLCNTKEPRTDYCDIRGDIRIHAKSSTIYVACSEMGILEANNTWKIRPYARKTDREAMSSVREWSIIPALNHENIPKCTRNHSVPAVLFSSGGYAGNHFHAFSDVIIPLYQTARPFDGEVKLLVTNRSPYWINKFMKILENLSKYEYIDIDTEEEVHCFSNVIVGLKHTKELSIDPSKSPHTMRDFREFLRSAYSLKRSTAIKLRDGENKKPRLLLVSRKRTRAFTNVGKIAKMAKRLGFDVVVAEADMNVARFAEVVNSCDVVMGVHGAGLTNIVFLPESAVLIQILPLGNTEWLGKTYFGDPSRDMNLKYLEYKIGIKESTLIEQYPPDHILFKDPHAFHKGNWLAFKEVYLQKQNVKLDVSRFRPTLVKALELLHE